MPSKLFGSQSAAKPHLVSGKGGVAGEVDDLRGDVEAAFTSLENGGGLMKTDEFVDPPAADVDAFVTSVASAATEQTYSGASLDGAIGVAEISPPRNVVITTTVNADIDAVGVVVTGTVTGPDGTQQAQTETITLTDGGNAAGDAGAKPFSFITSIVIPAQSGPGGSVQIGTGVVLGLSDLMVSRAGLLAPIREVAAGTVVTTGTFTNEAGSPVTSYTPAAAPDGTNDYAVTYEV
jgi:hypothetical protein